ncbi:MAG: hypothetical protein KDA69_16685, partial [Planctomycetaceae bacterium]|nr:hypothetical protein [Planctomycetaceae bacterium]
KIPAPLPPNLPASAIELIEQAAVPVPQGVVVMNDGRVFEGNLREVPGGYRVEKADGTYNMVPFDLILATAESVPAAYRKLRNSVSFHTVDSHMKLAEWCRDQGLMQEARLEVAAALELEPLRSDARQLLKEIEANVNPRPLHHETAPAPAMTADGFTKPENRTAQGLSDEATREFIIHIQPMMMNKCGNARCHGGDQIGREFHFQMVRGQTNQTRTSDQNLAALMAQIDFASPEASPLLQKPQESTEFHRFVFRGSTGIRQLQILQAWVAQVARDKSPAQSPRMQQRQPSEVVLASGFEPNPSELGNGRALPQNGSPHEFLNGILREEQPDPFDPEVFNRQVHGRTAAEMQGQQTTSVNAPAAEPAPSSNRLPGIAPSLPLFK